MDTERIKNILIALLSVATLVLSGLIFMTESRYTLSAAQEAAIISILQRDDIHFHGEVVRDFRPMRKMEMHRYDYDLDGLASRFFGDKVFVVDADFEDHVVYRTMDGNKVMAYSAWTNIVSFEIFDGITNEIFSAAPGARAAELLATEYIESIMGMPNDMLLHSTILNRQGHWVVNFFSSYRGHMLHNDHIRVHVTENGIIFITYSRVCAYHRGLIGEARSIFSGDEALMALMNYMRHGTGYGAGVQGRIMINDMRLSYFLTEEGGQSVGIPVYVFSVYVEGGLRFNYIFNAFTNAFVWFERAL